MLTPDQRSRLESRLREERLRALETLGEFDRERATSLLENTGEISLYRLHPADIGTEAMELEKQFLLASNEGRHLYEIDEALRRLFGDPERVGICENCGGSITMERLEMIPWARLCAECQKRAEETIADG